MSSNPSAKTAGNSSNVDLEAGHGIKTSDEITEVATSSEHAAGQSAGSGTEKPDDEYIELARYISNHGEATNEQQEQEQLVEVSTETRPWWAFWRKGGAAKDKSKFVTPADWLSTDIAIGLSTVEVERRRRHAGWNELVSEKENMLLKILYFFRGPILYVMEIAAVIALCLRDWIEFGVIIGILLLNAFVGWYQEKQISLLLFRVSRDRTANKYVHAADVVASLKGDITMKARVVRDQQESEIPARDLVPGDIIIVQDGEVIPADARLICEYSNPLGFHQYQAELQALNIPTAHTGAADNEGGNGGTQHGRVILACDQSALTGESLAVDKFMTDVIFYTTGCKHGKAYAIVIKNAPASMVGVTAKLVENAEDQGHFKAIMNSIGRALLVLVVFFTLVAWVGGFYREIRIIDSEDSSHSLIRYMLSLLIVGVPVGLPVVTTTTLAVGAAYLAKEKAIVQKLTAIESLAGVDILCTDKTGTLTTNQLTLRQPYTLEGVDANWMMAVASLASSHNVAALDAIDRLTILALKRYPEAKQILADGWRTIKFTPFDPVSKMTEAECERAGVRYTCIKGSATAVLNKCRVIPSDEGAAAIRREDKSFAARGLRCIAVAVRENGGAWQLLGLLSMHDPPRADTQQTIVEAQALGLSVKMLTGDALTIAKETCKALAMGTKVYKSERLLNSGVPGSAVHDLCERADGFAEVFPKHKYEVVEKLQQRGHLTGMTGDGVNDAPSLKKSDCGIAVQGASAAAQAAADIVLLEPGLSTIISAIKTSRQIFQRMKAYIQYRIALCIHLEIYLVTAMLGINETLHLPLVAFLALFADLATIAVGFDNAHYERRPVEWQLPKIWIISVVLGVLLATGTWVLRGTMWLPRGGIIDDYGSVQGILFLEIALTQNWLIFVTRGFRTRPSWKLVGAIAAVDVLAVLFACFGWMTGGVGELGGPSSSTLDLVHPSSSAAMANDDGSSRVRASGRTDGLTVLVVFLYSLAVAVVMAVVYHVMTGWKWLDDVGRKKRSRQDTAMQVVLANLSKVVVEVDRGATGDAERFYLATRQADEEDD